MLRFDRYLAAPSRSHTIDLATGRFVDLEHSVASSSHTLFQTRLGRMLIDIELVGDRRMEVWERWGSRRRPEGLEAELQNFTEMLECARHGAPRAFDLSGRPPRDHDYFTRMFAREARVRGWVPIAVELLGAVSRLGKGGTPSWLADRSLVIFAQTPLASGAAVPALVRLARRDARPHVIVRTFTRGPDPPSWLTKVANRDRVVLHESVVPFGARPAHVVSNADPEAESAARWAWIIAGVTNGSDHSQRAIELADVLVAREQPFEARAVLATVPAGHPELAARQAEVLAGIHQRAVDRAIGRLGGGEPACDRARGYEMVDDFVDVLRICQDIEDEHTALARVGAFLRDRLQAASVAFVAREGSSPRVLARVGSEAAGLGMAVPID